MDTSGENNVSCPTVNEKVARRAELLERYNCNPEAPSSSYRTNVGLEFLQTFKMKNNMS